MPRMLSRMRKRGLGLVLSNQYLGQLFKETRDAIEGTVGTMIAFEIGEDDAGELKTYFNGFERDDLTRLGEYSATVSMRVGNNRQSAFNIETLPPPGMGTRALSLEALGRDSEALAEYVAIDEAAPESAWGMLAALHFEAISGD